jgi:hypothetical protein
MGNLGLEIKSLKTILTTIEGERKKWLQHLYKD